MKIRPLALTLALALTARAALAQTDYYNTDAGRPILIEDAYPVEFRGIELQLAPLRLERIRAGAYHWGLEPELAIGILPRTQIELGVPLAHVEAGGRQRSGVAGIELSALHNLNVETRIPALGIGAEVLFPVGPLAPGETYASVKGLATKTFRFARFHANAQYTFGKAADVTEVVTPPNPPPLEGPVEVSRWLAGVAVDRTFPLRSLLVTAEVHAAQPLHADEALEWTVGGGWRYQYDPRWAIDAGVGRRVTGREPAWYATFGAAYAVGMPWRGQR